jgi:WD40 repeat protein
MRRKLTLCIIALGVVCAVVSAPTGGAAIFRQDKNNQPAVTLKRKLPGYEGPSAIRRRGALVQFSPDAKWLVTSGKDRSLNIYEAASGELKATLKGGSKAPDGEKQDGIGGFSFSPDGRQAATRNQMDKAVRLWRTADWKLQATLSGRQRNTESWFKKGMSTVFEGGYGRVPFSPDGRFLLAEREDDLLDLWDTSGPEKVATLDHYTESTVGRAILERANHVLSMQAVYSGNGRVIATCNGDKQPKVWNAKSGRLQAIINSSERIYIVALNQDGSALATMQLQGAIELWDAETGKLRKQLEGNNRAEYDFHGFEFSPDGKYIATFLAETTKIWEVATGQLKHNLPKIGKAYDATFSPDGKLLATASTDNGKTLGVVWNAETGAVKYALPPSGSAAQGIGFSPDSRWLITVGEKGVKLWNAADGKPLADLPDARYPVAFSRDTGWLATGSREDAALLWEMPR